MFVLPFWSQHTPAHVAGMLYSHHPRAKEVPAVTGSIFSCIIYLNTCLTILDGAQSGKGGPLGHPRIPSRCGCICWSVSILWPRSTFFLAKNGSDRTTRPADKSPKKHLQCHALTRRLSQSPGTLLPTPSQTLSLSP